jgi:hypothetical protein
MRKASDLLRQAAAKREEASSRRGLARLALAGEPERELERQAHELEVEAASLEREAALLRSEGPRSRRRGRSATEKRR